MPLPHKWVPAVSAAKSLQRKKDRAELCLILATNCSLPGSSVLGILQARILEWVATSFSRGSSRPGNWIQVSKASACNAAEQPAREVCWLPLGMASKSWFVSKCWCIKKRFTLSSHCLLFCGLPPNPRNTHLCILVDSYYFVYSELSVPWAHCFIPVWLM